MIISLKIWILSKHSSVCSLFIAKVNRVLPTEFMHRFNDTSSHKNKFNYRKIVTFCILAQTLSIPPKMELSTFCSKSHRDYYNDLVIHHFIRNEILLQQDYVHEKKTHFIYKLLYEDHFIITLWNEQAHLLEIYHLETSLSASWWLFPHLQGFWENVWPLIPCLHFLIYFVFLKCNLACTQ